VLWVGAELDELLAAADRLVVLCAGRRPTMFHPPWDRHAIGLAMAGVDAEPGATNSPPAATPGLVAPAAQPESVGR